MRKFNWDEFKNEENKIAVHCKTEEEAKDFCRKMHEHGMRWCDDGSFLKTTEYAIHEEKTCYSGSGTIGSFAHFIGKGYEILEWSDYMQKEFTKADLKDGMVVEQRNENRYLLLGETFANKSGYNKIIGYENDLKWKGGYPGGDIVRVYRIIPGSIKCLEEVFFDENLELIWERKEPKKMTVEEMRQKLEDLTGEEIEVTA
jgi:hypothetical protein